MKISRPAALVIAIVCFSIQPFVFAFAFKTDGYDADREWIDAKSYKLVYADSNCGVTHGLVKVKFDSENSAVYLCFRFVDPGLEKDNEKAGISATFEDSEPFVLTVVSGPREYDMDRYRFEGATSIDEQHGATCEIRLGMKYGLPRELCGSVRFIDALGEPSNVYKFVLVNEEYVETSARILTSGRREPETSRRSKTARTPGTTEEKTTKRRRTSGPATTQERTTEFVIKTSPPCVYERKTEPPTARRKTDSPKISAVKTSRAKKPSSRGPKKPETVIRYVEKEIIVSLIYVVRETETAPETTAETTAETTRVVEDMEAVVSVSRGKLYRAITTVGGAVLTAAVAAWGAASSGKGGSLGKKGAAEKEAPDGENGTK